ncbi:16S rRNA (guanine(966)-N(2))-methyltransferase RsmD [Bryocella elongata]|uniref:16S rRNA (Guanine(966)-N(2))-methyltransferase RsmD n=1 Tax=Bryocella elongata TaxID=863522 RepID=A0A1H5WJN3_9BACT|nr:16S rRNA (guanine(966)-N(2))-methyltransferase RsmD [Bryocella elongata]SEF99508.1 16S rRNA (guanine(966)-N(2))-methyltransferase RsmD [Bryocella elongata]
MRVIAGEYRSRLLAAPCGLDTRPTSDKLRGTLFNVLGPRLVGVRFADLYAGSGAVGIEAISRGAEFVWFAENARPAATAIRDNLRTLKIASGYALEDRGARKLLESLTKKGTALDVVFLDPPYEEGREYEETLGYLGRNAAALLNAEAVVVAEHSRKKPLTERYGKLMRTRVLEQGEAALSFYGVEQGE